MQPNGSLAKQGLKGCFSTFARKNISVIIHIFEATRQAMAKLAQTPQIGSLYPLANSGLQGLRKWKVK